MQDFPRRKEQEIKVRIEPEIKGAVQRRAETFGRTVSQHVRELIRGDLATARRELPTAAQQQEAGAQ